MGQDHEGGQPQQPRKKRRVGKELFGPGAVGAWTEEELANLPEWEAPPEEATRDQEDSDALREGVAIEGRRKRVGTRRLGEANEYGGGRGERGRAERGKGGGKGRTRGEPEEGEPDHPPASGQEKNRDGRRQ
jgi:hypothetical protein